MRILGTSRITGKSQVTVPKAVRDIFKLEKGDLLVFVRSKGQIVVRKGKVELET